MITQDEIVAMVCEEREAWKSKATDLREVIDTLRKIVDLPECEDGAALGKLNLIRRILA